jgi:UDP-N-acetyl-D-galactosamine dehydrogenase
MDIVRELESYGIEVLVHDPLADKEEARLHYGIDLRPWEDLTGLGALIFAVAHSDYKQRPAEEYIGKLGPAGCLIDVKCVLDPAAVKAAGVPFWRL